MGSGINIGIGQGAAQVIDTRNYTNQLLRQRELNERRAQQEQQEVASMLSKLTPDKLRNADVPEFNNKYRELKDLYINNKGLYSRPADHPEQYKRSQDLIQQLQQMTADSKELDSTLDFTGKEIFKNSDKFDDAAVSMMKEASSMPTSEIKKKYGRLLTMNDFEYKPVSPDYEKILKSIKGRGMTTFSNVVTKHTPKNGIPLGKIGLATNEVNDPMAIDQEAESLWVGDSGFRKFYTKAFNDIGPERIAEIQADIDKKFGEGKFEITDPETFAKADLLQKFNVVPGKQVFQDDEEWKSKEEDRRDQRNFRQQKEIAGIQDQYTRGRMVLREEQRNRRQANKPSDEDLTRKNVSETKEVLISGDIDKINKKLLPLYERVDKIQDGAGLIDPRKETLKDFKSKINAWNTRLKSQKNSMFMISDEQANELYTKRIPVVAFHLKPKSGKKGEKGEARMFNPLSQNFDSMYYGLLKSFGATRKHGIGDNSDDDYDNEE